MQFVFLFVKCNHHVKIMYISAHDLNLYKQIALHSVGSLFEQFLYTRATIADRGD